MKNVKITSNNICNSGEYFIASYLSAKNFVVTITLGRAIGFDLLAVNPNGKTFKIQVKSTPHKTTKKFPLNVKNEKIISDDLFYAFVRLNDYEKMPDFWILPSNFVAETITNNHKKFLARGGGDSAMRTMLMYQNQDLPENWEETISKFKNNIQILLDFGI